jgi:hypothetical protein
MSFATTECIHPTAKKQPQAPQKSLLRPIVVLVDRAGFDSILSSAGALHVNAVRP